MSKSEAKNEIDNLLSEIQALQQTLGTPEGAKAAAELGEGVGLSESPEEGSGGGTPEGHSDEGVAEEGEDAPRIVEADDQFLEEFTANAELPEESVPESDMEATLAALRPEEPVGGALAEMASTAEEKTAPAATVRPVRPVDTEISKMVTETLSEPQTATPRAGISRAGETASFSSAGAEEGALSLNLRGKISLELIYESFDQKVRVSFGESFLTVSLQDGTEFKIPVAKKGSARVKAVA